MNAWIRTHTEKYGKDEALEKTEVLELPHGCLVRTTVIMAGLLGSSRPAVAVVFVPNMKLERHADTVEFKHSL